jgi:transcriptional regulator with XRE-family HTH domain
MADNITPLAQYLKQVMQDQRFRSERSFAAKAGISPRTLGRLLRGEKVDPEPLQKIADMLSIPVENLYRLAGYLPAEEAQTQVLREIENLLRQLPEADQRRILEVVRVEHKFREQREQQSPQTDSSSRQKAG